MKHWLLQLQRIIPLLLILFSFAFTASAVVFESGIPGAGPSAAPGASIPTKIDTYINFIYIFALGIVGIAGFISLVVWGTVWIGSGIIDKKAMALESIKNTFIGIGLALAAYAILNTINPELVIIKTPTSIKPKAPANAPVSPGLGTISGGGSTSVPDGGLCANQPQCYPGSICGGLQIDDAGVSKNLGKCERIADTALESECIGNDANASACVATRLCRYCQMPNGSTRCLSEPKARAYNKCTE